MSTFSYPVYKSIKLWNFSVTVAFVSLWNREPNMKVGILMGGWSSAVGSRRQVDVDDTFTNLCNRFYFYFLGVEANTKFEVYYTETSNEIAISTDSCCHFIPHKQCEHLLISSLFWRLKIALEKLRGLQNYMLFSMDSC